MTFLLAHGYGCNQTIWQPLLAQMPEIHALTFDWPGAGQSSPSAYDAQRHASVQGYVADLVALARELVADGHRLVFVGHSFGATCGMLAGVQAPAFFEQLVLVAPSPCFANHPPDYEGGFEREALHALVEGLVDGQEAWARSIAPLAMGHPDRPHLADALAGMMCSLDPAIALRWARATFFCDVRDQVHRVHTPSLILQCRDDVLAPPTLGPWMHARMPGSTFRQLRATGHCPHVSESAELAAVLREHVLRREYLLECV